MQITVRTRPDTAPDADRSRDIGGVAQELRRIGDEAGAQVWPMHPNTDDPDLSRYYVAEVADHPTAERVIARLRQCPSVEAAYFKPAPEPP